VTIRVRIRNLNEDWRHEQRVRVTTQEKDSAGDWQMVSVEILDAAQWTDDNWIHPNRRFIIDELDLRDKK
jgi:hypothetical protein